MLKSKWNGVIQIGLLSVPARLFKAQESGASISFTRTHKNCGEQLKSPTTCRKCNVEVATDQIDRAFEYAKGFFVTISDEELALAQSVGLPKGVIQITKIVPRSDIDQLAIEETDYVAPGTPAANLAFVVLRDALQGKAAIGTILQSNKEQLVAVEPYGDGMVCHRLRYATEMRPIEDVAELHGLPQTPARELSAMKMLLATYEGPFVHDDYVDEYTGKLKATLEKKASGEITVTPEVVVPAPPPSDLMAQLLASLQTQPSVPAKATLDSVPVAKRRKKA